MRAVKSNDTAGLNRLKAALHRAEDEGVVGEGGADSKVRVGGNRPQSGRAGPRHVLDPSDQKSVNVPETAELAGFCRARCAIERDSGVNGSPTGKFFIVAKRSSAERWGNVSSIVAHALENPYKNILIRNLGPSIFGAMTARRTWIDSLSDGFFEVSLDDTLRHLIMVYRKRE